MPSADESKTDYYVYILFDGAGRPFYVGKGRGSRWLHHERIVRNHVVGKMLLCGSDEKDTILASMIEAGLTIPKVKIAEGLPNIAALMLESIFIRAIGTRPDGPLVNDPRK